MNLPVRLSDFLVLYRRLKEKGASRLFTTIISSEEKRITSSWSHTQNPASGWWEIETVRRRIQWKVTGDHDTDIPTYFLDKYVANAQRLRALSLGCGTGEKELAWARTGQFAKIDAFDISDTRINKAVSRGREEQLDEILNFFVADVRKFPFHAEQYDLIIAEGILHHLAPLDVIVQQIQQGLKRDGYLVVNDFVGPSRFQWTGTQLGVVNALLTLLPHRFQKRRDGSIKRKVYKPGWLGMWLSDPSEAAESSRIVQNLLKFFSVLETKDYGGTVLHLLLKDIVHNFSADDVDADRILHLCFDVEDIVLEFKEVESDYKFIVCKNNQVEES